MKPIPVRMLVVCALQLVALAGCSAPRGGTLPSASAEVAPPITRDGYILQLGDMVSVKFYYNPELNEDLVVRPDGMISMQLIGDVKAAGLSPAALAQELTERYAGELAAPKVSVIVRQFGGERVYVSGEVGKQGVVPLTVGLTLYQAIQEAGGLLDSAHRKQVVLIRRGQGGQVTGVAIDIRPIENGESPDEDVPLRPYDMVFVPKSKIANVDVFVDQYVRKIIPPIPFAVGF